MTSSIKSSSMVMSDRKLGTVASKSSPFRDDGDFDGAQFLDRLARRDFEPRHPAKRGDRQLHLTRLDHGGIAIDRRTRDPPSAQARHQRGGPGTGDGNACRVDSSLETM